MTKQYCFQKVDYINRFVLYEWTARDAKKKQDVHSWVGYLLPPQKNNSSQPSQKLSFDESWAKYPGNPMNKINGGCYLFCRESPKIKNGFLNNIINTLNNLNNNTPPYNRYIIWIFNPNADTFKDMLCQPIPFSKNNGNVIIKERSGVYFGNIFLDFPKGVILKADMNNNLISFTQTKGNPLKLRNSNGPKEIGSMDNIDLPLSPVKRGKEDPNASVEGALVFNAKFETYNYERGNDFNNMQAGLKFFYKNDETIKSQLYPIWRPMEYNIEYNVLVSLDPLWPSDPVRTCFKFINNDNNGPPGTFWSCFSTPFGQRVNLTPVAEQSQLIFMESRINSDNAHRNTPDLYYLVPAGDFVTSFDNPPSSGSIRDSSLTDVSSLMCGLSGTESLTFQAVNSTKQGIILHFSQGQPAYAPNFPFKQSSPVGPPIDPDAKLLDDTFKTSWVTFKPGSDQGGIHYLAQPKGASLFGQDELIFKKYPDLLGHMTPGYTLPKDSKPSFPLVPYAGVTPGDGKDSLSPRQIEDFERQVIGPTRRSVIAETTTTMSPSVSVSLFTEIAREAAADDGLRNTTTPAGFITRYKKSDGSWKQLLLSQVLNQSDPGTQQMGFTALQGELQAAFQTSEQFLIVANNKYLGTPATGAFMPPSPKDIYDKNLFYNTINIGKWNFGVPTGEKNRYGDYRSVMIVKGVKGKIFDIDAATGKVSHDSLVSSPDKWTMKDKFAAPSVVVKDAANDSASEPQLSQLIPLSNWLVDYCKDAYAKKESLYFANFVKIIQDENWTGVLILKAEIADVPTELAGILAGVKNPTDFYVHHIGIEIGQIDQDKVEQKDSTSMFGLVYYVDPRYVNSPEPHPIAPSDMSAPYDFTLLTLKALFENSAIKKFNSLAQMVLKQLFGSTVTQMVDIKPHGDPEPNLYNAVLLEGGMQKNGDAVIYRLSSKWPNRYSLANNVLTSVEIDTAQMSTRDDGSKSGQVVSWIGMSGFMNFAVIPGIVDKKDPKKSLPQFDIFSFGPEDEQKDELRKGLNFNNLGLEITIPKDATGGGDPPPASLKLVEGEISFNSVSSTPRDESIYKSFQLELLGMLSGNASAEKKEEEKSDPNSLGYLTVATQYGLQGVTSGKGTWHGLKFKLNLGTPGALAGKVNLDSSLMVAWSDDSGASEGSSGYQATVGIELPGTGSGGDLFSLQTVIKLSIGAIQLFYTLPVATDTKKPGGFLLLLNEIALKLLGLMKIPPSGNTAFFLFGNKDVKDSTGLGWFAIFNQGKEKQKNATD